MKDVRYSESNLHITGDTQQNKALKLDDGKLMMDLFEPEFEEEIVKALTYGAKEYGRHNWRKGFDWSRPFSALKRHINKWRKGEAHDPESKAHHLAAAAVNLMFLYYHEKENLGKNDL